MMDGVGFNVSKEWDNFDFTFHDPLSEEANIDNSKRSLIFTDKYLEIGFTLPSQILFGLGQHNSEFILNEGDYTMFNRDQPGSPEATGEGEQHLYGTHPFIMAKTKDNKFVGVLLYNSNPQQVTIRHSNSGKSLVTFKTIGGILDLYYFTADTADAIIRKYNWLVGKPSLPPFWAMGFHQCSWAYDKTQDMIDAVTQYREKGYMFDTIWSDIAYMEKFIDFTVDNKNYAGLKDFIDEMKKEHTQFVPIVDAGISILPPSSGPNWYKEGTDAGIFVKSTQNPDDNDGNLIGKVWPGYTAFVDFLHPDADTFWSKGLEALDKLAPFDGVWLDMNEPSNFCEDSDGKPIGECFPEKTQTSETKRNLRESPVKPGEYDKIPFTPGNKDLNFKTLSMDSYFYDKEENGTFTMYNIHNMYGTLETMATHNYLKARDNKRQLIISRDSFVGHGKYGSIWTGDNDSNKRDMELSINQIMNFNQFGMPFVGGDICGFTGNTTSTLCARWAQVGAFYPFMRNHYAIDSIPQEFYVWDDKYQTGMKENLKIRYSLLRYMYTCLYKSSSSGDPMIRHPMYEWPDVSEMVNNKDSFLIGYGIRVSANFDINEEPEKYKTNFVKGRYLEFRSYELMEIKSKVTNKELYNGWDHPNVHVLEGSIIPFQDTSVESGVTRSYDLLNKQMRLLVFPDSNGYAKGNLYISRGETYDDDEQFYTIIHSSNTIKVIFEEGDVTDKGSELNEVLEEVHILHTESTDKVDFACAMDKDQNLKQLKVEKAVHPESKQSYIRIFGGDNTIEFDMIDNIFYGVTGEDYNYCNRGFVAHSQSETKSEKTYLLKKEGEQSNDDGLTLTLTLLKSNVVEMKITDGSERFIVPSEVLNSKSYIMNTTSNDDADINDFVTVSNETSKFSLQLHESKNPDSVYFQIDEDSLTFSEFFLSMETQVNTDKHLYGVGERVTDFYIKEGTYTTWANDQTDPVDDGERPGKNIYGTHPVYFTRSKSGNKLHWGMFNLNANAQDTKIKYDVGLGAQISHYISGQGIFDMYFFLDNPDPESVVSKYHDIIGPTLLPPFWGMGWHQCKYGYNSTEKLKSVYDKYNENDFPMDVLWSDIDYMVKYRDFTFDKEGAYKGLDTFVKDTLHANNRRYVPIIDAGVAIVNDGSYSVFEDGKKKGVFIQSGNKKRTGGKDPVKNMDGILYGKVWPGYAAFPDFTNDKAVEWWIKNIDSFHDKVEFDGLWLDMNEVANFCTGACIPEDVVPAEDSLKSKLIYMPGGRDIEDKCLSIDGKHSKGSELNYHSLFGFMQGIATNKYFENIQKRAFIISRSTFAGQGKYTSHWNGDNHSLWNYLKLSVTGVINMNLYGINFNGADICGFLGDTTPELCQKWINVGAFYPFARNHDDIGNDGQEPYIYKESIQNTMRQAIRWRYALLRYMYTQLYTNHVYGGMFWKPLFFEFPSEDHAYDDVERNVMIGKSIKLSPMLDEANDKTQSFIFPTGVWCNLFDYKCFSLSKTSDQSLSTVPEHLNLHLRMGQIIPIQRNALEKVMNTVDLNNLPMGLAVNIDTKTNKAEGVFYADDGESLNPSSHTFIKIDLEYDGKNDIVIKFSPTQNSYTSSYTKLDTIEIMGATFSGVKGLLKMKVDGGEEITGNFDRTNNVVTFKLDTPVEMTTLTNIEITK